MPLPAVHIEVVVTRLPKLRRLINVKQQLLIGILNSRLRAQLARNALLQDLHDSCNCSLCRSQEEFVTRLRAVGEWLSRYGDAIYSTRGGPLPPADWGVTTEGKQSLCACP
jgi:hypothetical protein